MERIAQIAHKLSTASVKKYNNPYIEFDWPAAIDESRWQFSPELISIYGLDEFSALDEAQQKKLAFWEAVNFYGLNIHGEKALIAGLANSLYHMEWSPEISEYIHHFLDEENKHMTVFGNFCQRYGKKIYPNKKLNVSRTYEKGEADFLFFAKVVIFEELVDHYNVAMSKDNRLDDLSIQINAYHHADESRHLAFGRELTKNLYQQWSPTWSDETRQGTCDYLKNYLIATWREYYNPSVYNDAGLDDSYGLYQKAWNSDAGKQHRLRVSQPCIDFFMNNAIIDEAPKL